MNKRDKNKRLKGFGIPVEVCVTSAATYRGVWATSAACAKLVVFRRTLGRVAMSDMTAERERA